MSYTKAELVKLGVEKYGIKNAADMSYRQLTAEMKAINNGGEAPKPKVTVSKPAPTKLTASKRKGLKSVGNFKRPYTVELRKGLVRYYYVIKAPNGEVTSTSQKYFSKSNANRAATAAVRYANA